MPNTDRATNWSVTINMKNVSKSTADECIACARQKGWQVDGQMEQGHTEGTPHYQLHVKTPQVRFSAVKGVFPTAHIEIARKVSALALYVKKEETRVGPLPERDEKYVTTSQLWDMIYDEFNTGSNDGWDLTNDLDVVFYNDEVQLRLSQDPLAFFDKVMGRLIRRGYMVDMLVINPGVRAFWKKFYQDVLFRSRASLDRQTDRQDEKLSHAGSINNESCEDTEATPQPDSSGAGEDDDDYTEGGGSQDETDSEGGCSGSSEADDREGY